MIHEMHVWSVVEMVVVLPHVTVVEIEKQPLRMIRPVEDVTDKIPALFEKLVPLAHRLRLRGGQWTVVHVPEPLRIFLGPLPIRQEVAI